jgi:hypothetical protein
MENKFVEEKLKDHDEKLKDTEGRIRRLEESDVQQKIQLTNIEKGQSEIKLMMSEQSKDNMRQSKEQQQSLNEFTKSMIDYFKTKELDEDKSKKEKELEEEKLKLEQIKSKNAMKFYNTKQFWAIASMIIGGVLAYFGLK